ncbi:Translation initiation inhibitor (plasmid) [Paraburkholderia caribensis MBA4]|uniref:Translation initiation inhibitor n=1 Tax=Paraburkholderia caribensis MBA4 TaxID=1323664 RepID=A0A0P0RN10_9BURK|nr:RidA family protein [Paraburkholderia caribensis]ALL70206.1 Translation initiation inhibitor [Paraburkholderia caribensis MBA4]
MSFIVYHRAPDAAPPPPSARYSHAVEAGGWLHVTGQLPIDPDAPDQPLPEGIKAQAQLCFRNIERIVEHAGFALSETVFVRIYLREFDADYTSFNSIYDRYFDDTARLPARTTIGVAQLGRNARVEIDVVLYSAR